MTVYAVTPFKHDGKRLEVGAKLDSVLDDEELKFHIANGSAVETGKTRKFTAPPPAEAQSDADTRKRDELLFKASVAEDDEGPSPAAALAAEQGALRDQAESEAQANEQKAAGK